MSSQLITFLLIILVLGVIAIILLLLRKKSGGGEEKLITMMERLSQLAEQNKELRQAMDSKLSETHRVTQEQFSQTIRTVQGITGQSAKQIADVVAGLTKLEETNKQVVNFSAQLQNLQDILKNPKQRGVLGEYYLEETLKNVLPPNSYQMQYPFKDGSIVDAVVFVKDKIIPVDSKFSLENYEKIINCSDAEIKERLEKQFKQDLKNRIDETSKYVKPGEKTMDFAFMFIPSEAIYYDLLINKVGAVQVNTRDLIEYAFKEKHVIIVSPTSFLAYLQTVLQGLRALQIEESAKTIRANVEKLSRHLLSYDDFMKKLGISMSTTVNHYNNAYKEFKKLDKDVVKITEGESKVEPMILDKPRIEE
ncbi:MAG: DNA recombination protein RmuC [Patescibacteria group bacterium]|nr:DNA recombination protein RmuC [Patescibacteria group bacterium]